MSRIGNVGFLHIILLTNRNQKKENRIKFIQLLIDKGIDINMITSDNRTALDIAYSLRDTDSEKSEIIELLEKNGAKKYKELNR